MFFDQVTKFWCLFYFFLGSSMSTEKIVMIASISGLGLLMIMFILGFYLLRKKKRQQQRMSDNELRREFPPIIHFSGDIGFLKF